MQDFPTFQKTRNAQILLRRQDEFQCAWKSLFKHNIHTNCWSLLRVWSITLGKLIKMHETWNCACVWSYAVSFIKILRKVLNVTFLKPFFSFHKSVHKGGVQSNPCQMILSFFFEDIIKVFTWIHHVSK